MIPGSGRSPGEGNGNQLWYSCLGNPIDWKAWEVIYSPWGRKRVRHNLMTKPQQLLTVSTCNYCVTIRNKCEDYLWNFFFFKDEWDKKNHGLNMSSSKSSDNFNGSTFMMQNTKLMDSSNKYPWAGIYS